MGITFTPVTGQERDRLRAALLANGTDGAALHMDPRTTTFRPAPADASEESIDALIQTIRSVPCHYADERTEYEHGRDSARQGGDWRDNPHRPGSRDWFAFEDGRQDGGALDVGPAPGTPAWA